MGAVFFARGDSLALPWQSGLRAELHGPDTPIAQLRNLGPRSARLLEAVGIRTLVDLEDAGVIEAFRRLVKAGNKPGLSLLYAMQGALSNTDWQQLPQTVRDHLRETITAQGWLEERVE
jgi:DNA transformation protein